MKQKLLNRVRIHDDIDSAWSWNGNIWCVTKKGQKTKLKPNENINEVVNTKQGTASLQNNRPLPPRAGTARHFGASPTSITVTGAEGLLPASNQPSNISTTSKVDSTPNSIVSSPRTVTVSPNTSTASTVRNVSADIQTVSVHR